MQEYSQVVINALPLMLSQDSKGKAAVTIASYMNAMLRNVKTEQDLTIFAQTLAQCKDFSSQNNLGGLNRTCAEWNHEGIIKLNQIRGISQQNTQQNDMGVAQKLYDFLVQTIKEINKTGMIDPDDFQVISSQLDQVEASLISTGNQYLSQEQIQAFMQEIMNQREQIRVKYALIDEILESSHMTR